MQPKLNALLGETPRKMLGVRALKGETAPKRVGDDDVKRLIGRCIERALARIDMPKKDAADRMGYADQSSLANWISAVETPQLHRLWAIGPEFQKAFVIELARQCSGFVIEETLRAKVSA